MGRSRKQATTEIGKLIELHVGRDGIKHFVKELANLGVTVTVRAVFDWRFGKYPPDLVHRDALGTLLGKNRQQIDALCLVSTDSVPQALNVTTPHPNDDDAMGGTLDAFEWHEAHRYVDHPGYDRPSRFSEELARAIPIERHKTRLLDVGCGSGVVGIYCLLKKDAAYVTFHDIRKEMIRLARKNLKRHTTLGAITPEQVSDIQCDFEELPPDLVASHDIMAFNAPQLPEALTGKDSLADLRTRPLSMMYRVGGKSGSNPDGLTVVGRFCRWYAALRQPKPTAILTLSSFLGRSRIEKIFGASGLSYRLVVKPTRIPLRKALHVKAHLLYASAPERRDRSLEYVDGRWTKLLLSYEVKSGVVPSEE